MREWTSSQGELDFDSRRNENVEMCFSNWTAGIQLRKYLIRKVSNAGCLGIICLRLLLSLCLAMNEKN